MTGPLAEVGRRRLTAATLRGAAGSAGPEIYALAEAIFPICRSITGEGVRRTLEALSAHLDLEVVEVASGTPVFDWVVPREWNIRDAYIADAAGRRIVDFRRSNLHVMSYSVPVRRTMTLAELAPHVFTLASAPDVVPYRTSYYRENWGFCMTHRQWLSLPDGRYEVVIDSTLADGALVYGEYLHRGESNDEVLLSAHVCHPSLANDNCSGLAMLAQLAHRLAGRRTRLSYRFLFAPGTIGAIAWLAGNASTVGRIRHGLVVSCVGDPGAPSYKRSRRGDAMIDRAMAHVLGVRSACPRISNFSPSGYDERQYCSPGFDLPVGLFQRSPAGSFAEYHTSADDMSFITPAALEEAFDILAETIEILEGDRFPRGTVQKGEPQLGRRGLYADIGGSRDGPGTGMALLWVLNLADGRHSLLDMAERSGIPFATVAAAADQLELHGLLEPESQNPTQTRRARSGRRPSRMGSVAAVS